MDNLCNLSDSESVTAEINSTPSEALSIVRDSESDVQKHTVANDESNERHIYKCLHRFPMDWCKSCIMIKDCPSCGRTKRVLHTICKSCMKCTACGVKAIQKYHYRYCEQCGRRFQGLEEDEQVENMVWRNIRDWFPEHSKMYNWPLPPGRAFRKIPDILFPDEHVALVIEVDEKSHSGYTGELERMFQIAAMHNKPTVFIRYNPDLIYDPHIAGFYHPPSIKLKALREEITYWLNPEHSPTQRVTAVYLFYSKMPRRKVFYLKTRKIVERVQLKTEETENCRWDSYQSTDSESEENPVPKKPKFISPDNVDMYIDGNTFYIQ